MDRIMQDGAPPNYWLDMGNGTIPAPCTVDLRAVGPMLLSQVTGDRYRVERSAPLRPRVEDEHFLLAHQRRGTGRLQQHGATAVTAPGDIVLYSTAQPYTVEFDGAFQQTVARIAAVPLRAACPEIDTISSMTWSGLQPQVALVGAMIEGYFQADYTHLPVQAASHACEALRHALAGCALSVMSSKEGRRPSLRQFHLDRIRQFALARIGDSELSIVHLVKGLGISAAHIHRLFASEAQSFSTWLWDTRLEICHGALRNPSYAKLSISQVAYKYGFSHPAHFSRVYRARYGMTPSAWRNGARSAAAPQEARL